MDLEAIKEAALAFFKAYYAEHGKIPSVKLACKKIEGLYRNLFYLVFKDGVAEVCRLAGIPVPEDRIEATSKARNEREEAPRTPEKLDEEIKADEAEAALAVAQRKQAAEERARKARNEQLKLEAMEDPKKILPYLKSLEPEIVDPFFEICKSAELSPRRAWDEAVKVRGETWKEWGRIIRANSEELHLKAYVADVIEAFMPMKRLELAKERHRGDTYPCKCDVCKLRYEYEFRENGALLSCPNGCHTKEGFKTFYYFCPVCRDLGSKLHLFYNPSLNRLYCGKCGFWVKVEDLRLEPKGTKAGAFKRPIEELEAEKARLISEVSSLRGSKTDLVRKREKEERSLAKLRAERKREDRELDAVRDEKAKERRLRDSLKRENNREKRKREVYNSMAEFLTNPEIVDGSAIDDIIRTLEVARDLRKKTGHVGEAMKMTVGAQGKLLMRIAKGRYILSEKADERLKEQLARQQRKHEREIKVKDSQIAAERRRRETAEREREALVPWRDEDMKKLERENRRLRDRILTLEGKNSDLKSKLHLQRIMASS